MYLFAKVRPIQGNEAVSSLEKVRIGGVDQWVLIRGGNSSNPVLLMVHGGPGQSEMYLSHMVNGELEKHFVVVNWDQRGAAKSYSRRVRPETMNLRQLVSDGEEVIRYLQRRLGKENEKFYLHGHSFGTILGMLMAKSYPQYFHKYVGVGQAVNLQENLSVSYDYVMRKAEEAGDAKAILELKSIGRPPFYNFSKGLWKYSVWLDKYGGKTYKRDGKGVFKGIFSAPEYSLLDKFKFFRGVLFSVKHLHQEMLQADLSSLVGQVEVPVVFFLGRHDYSTPFVLAERYLDALQAPSKTLIWFEESGHLPQYEETELYCEQLIRTLLYAG
jgi:pimeloyl-ACP methyl ester carboxylesterase